VARALGIHPSTISRWWSLFKKGGFNALSRRPVSGRPPRLTPQEMRRIREAVERPPSAVGLSGRRWSLALLARFILKETGVGFHPSHAGRLFSRRLR
jgi:transposase